MMFPKIWCFKEFIRSSKNYAGSDTEMSRDVHKVYVWNKTIKRHCVLLKTAPDKVSKLVVTGM